MSCAHNNKKKKDHEGPKKRSKQRKAFVENAHVI